MCWVLVPINVFKVDLMSRTFQIIAAIFGVMVLVGFGLPVLLAHLAPDVNVPPMVWNVLQMGGIGGVLVFRLAARFSRR